MAEQEQQHEWWLYVKLIALGLVVAYLIAFVVENSKSVPIHWVFGTTKASLIFVILVSLAFGVFAGLVFSQLYRRRWRREHPVTGKQSSKPPDPVGDLGGRGETERKSS